MACLYCNSQTSAHERFFPLCPLCLTSMRWRTTIPQITTIIGHFSTGKHQFSGAIPHHLCIFKRKFRENLAVVLKSVPITAPKG